jgi:hypothetical protein
MDSKIELDEVEDKQDCWDTFSLHNLDEALNQDIANDNKSLTCSLEKVDALVKEIYNKDLLEKNKLGFDLPTNDKTKDGDLDNMSVDSFWIGEDEQDEKEA